MDLLKQELPQLQALIGLNASPNVNVETLALQELEYLRLQAVNKPDIMDAMPQTVILAVKAVMKNNLSLDPNAGLVYIKTRNINVGSKESPNLQKALEITPTCNGIISIARQCGRIIDIKRPTVTKDAHGRVIAVQLEYQLPNQRWELVEFDESDFERWRRASDKENGRNKTDMGAPNYKYANPNYTSWKNGIDPEFARAKAIRHGLKKLGTNMNERNAIAIQPTEMKQIIVAPQADEAVINETEIEEAEIIQNSEVVQTNESVITTTVEQINL
ncbi:MAG: hypothetical protein RL637_343 [Pseudomonadota bacterium]